MRLIKVAKELNISITNIIDFLYSKGIKISSRPNTKVSTESYYILKQEFNHCKEESKRKIAKARGGWAAIDNNQKFIDKNNMSTSKFELLKSKKSIPRIYEDKSYNKYLKNEKSFYENGNLKSNFQHKNGTPHGILKSFYENGQIENEGNFENGELHGILKSFYENGQIESEANFENGELHGIRKEFYENGQIENEGNFENGEPHGILKSFYENGQIESKANFESGELHGIRKEFYENGQIKIEEYGEYNKREGLRREFYYNGKIKFERHFKLGQQEGNQKEFDENGRLIYEGERIGGKQEGIWKLYYSDGSIKRINYFKNDEKISQKDWDENGVLQHKNSSNDSTSLESKLMDIIDKAKNKINENILDIEHRTDITNDEKADLIIKLFSGTCAAIAIQPIPFADFFVLTPIQAYMGTRLAAIRGLTTKQSEINTILKEIASVIGLGILAQQLAINAYRTFIPFLGAITTIPLVYGLTYAIGKTMDTYLIQKAKGISLSKKQMKDLFEEMLKKGEKEGRKNKDSIKNNAKHIN